METCNVFEMEEYSPGDVIDMTFEGEVIIKNYAKVTDVRGTEWSCLVYIGRSGIAEPYGNFNILRNCRTVFQIGRASCRERVSSPV